jgi:ubiquinone biosynthesis protein
VSAVAYVTDLADRARRSAWVAGEPGLADAVAEWDDEVGAARARLAQAAVQAAAPGMVAPDRLVQHAAAAGLSRAVRLVTRLPNDLSTMAPVRDTRQWARASSLEAFADQLALSGPASHEVARIIVGSGRLFPGAIRDELDHRVIDSPAVAPDTVHGLVAAAVDTGLIDEVDSITDDPIIVLPVTQLHLAGLPDDRVVFLRVRRPGVTRHIRADARVSASAAAALNRLMPEAGGMGPTGFVELIVRLALEATDLRFEALNAVELGLILEDAGHKAVRVARPVPGRVSARVIAFEHVPGVPLTQYGAKVADPPAVMAALATITLESALVQGTFWADPAPEHLLVTADGELVMVGVGAVGHFSPELRRAGILFLRSVMSGDAAGQVDAMRVAGAIPPGTDLEPIIDDLSTAEALQVSKILLGGEQGLLEALAATVRVLLTYNIKPPVEVVLLLRTVFALDVVSRTIMPEGGGLMAALLGLLPRLPDLLKAAEA